jgi:ferredoxin--NADP+ reductase
MDADSAICIKSKPGDEILLYKAHWYIFNNGRATWESACIWIGTGTALRLDVDHSRSRNLRTVSDHITVQHTVRQIEDLAYRDLVEGQLNDPLAAAEAKLQLSYDRR